ncbi:MAG TPA: hypothetical protein VF701_19950 [Thermoanaerobaculia bacterium]
MPDPLLALVLIVAFFFAASLASFFRTLDWTLIPEARVPLIAGAVAGGVIYFADFAPSFVVAGIILTAAALYVRLTGSESDAASGMLLGGMTGAAASVPLIFTRDHPLAALSACLLAGAVAGFGITLGLTQVRDRLRQAMVDVVTVIAAIGAAWLPTLALRFPRVTEKQVAISATALLPLLIVATVFRQWPAIRAELQGEAALGVIAPEDVRSTAHPLLRLGRGGWHDSAAHREFVRIANRIALRRLQQRSRAEEVARLYQLEVIKLRMQAQDMARIDRAMRDRAERRQEMPG